MFRSTFIAAGALAALLATAPARAEVIDLAWDAQGRFERQVAVPPGKFTEVCGKLARADRVAWRYDASGPLDFNIHYHEGKAVHYPARESATARSSGTLQAALDQDFCWMWTNKSGRAVELRLALDR